jgi:hypothetical protein
MQFFLLLDSQADVVVQACSKHELSPSKAEHEHEQKPKRLKGSYCQRRQEHLRNVLRDNFVESPGKSTDQDVVMDCLQVDSKNVTTRAVCGAFDNASFDKNKRVYKNIRKSLPFADNMFENGETKSTDTVISNLKEKLGECKAKAKNMMSNIMTIVEQGSSDNTFIKAMLQLYNKEIKQISIISEAMDAEYEKELKFLLEKRDKEIVSLVLLI